MARLVRESPKVKAWQKRVIQNGNSITKLEVLGYVSRNGKDLYSAFVDCRIMVPEGGEIPRCILITGDSVVIVPVLKCIDDGEIYTLMVEQRRVADGGYAVEFAAGGMEQESEPMVVACEEVEEELKIQISNEDLHPLSSEPIQVVPSSLEGRMHFFYFEKEVSLAFLREMDGLAAGREDEKEFIHIRAYKMSEVIMANTPSALMGLKLLEAKLRRMF
jgi:ADP-sugar diphosphatase